MLGEHQRTTQTRERRGVQARTRPRQQRQRQPREQDSPAPATPPTASLSPSLSEVSAENSPITSPVPLRLEQQQHTPLTHMPLAPLPAAPAPAWAGLSSASTSSAIASLVPALPVPSLPTSGLPTLTLPPANPAATSLLLQAQAHADLPTNLSAALNQSAQQVMPMSTEPALPVGLEQRAQNNMEDEMFTPPSPTLSVDSLTAPPSPQVRFRLICSTVCVSRLCSLLLDHCVHETFSMCPGADSSCLGAVFLCFRCLFSTTH